MSELMILDCEADKKEEEKKDSQLKAVVPPKSTMIFIFLN